MSNAKRQLFISFSGLITRIERGDVKIAEIHDDALFYFGCVKDLALNAENYRPDYVEGYGSEAEKAARQAIYGQLRPIFLKADAEGRLSARTVYEDNSYEELNKLLVANGATPLPSSQIVGRYDYSTVKEVVEQNHLPLEVIF